MDEVLDADILFELLIELKECVHPLPSLCFNKEGAYTWQQSTLMVRRLLQ
jgi:hypothetical protein